MADLPEPGWYPDPHQLKVRRYWDGQAWTDQREPVAEEGEAAPGWMLVLGYLGSFLFPLVGLLVGISLLVRRAIGHGIAMVGISIVIGVGGYLIAVNEDVDDQQNGRGHRSALTVEEQVDRALERREGKAKRVAHRIQRQVREGAGGD